jgi:hypothetical protein
MKSSDGMLGKVIVGKTEPGSPAARVQYRQMRLMLAGQWVFVLVVVLFAISQSISWIVLAVLVACCIGIPAQSRFLSHLRGNAYPDDPRA